jgi:hypothetical protein
MSVSPRVLAFGVVTGLAIVAETASWFIFQAPPAVAWAACAAVAVLLGLAGAYVLESLVIGPMRLSATQGKAELMAELGTQADRRRHLRHDLRGVLSPAMLTADRLLTNADPSVRRTGEIMVRTIERATELLSEGE